MLARCCRSPCARRAKCHTKLVTATTRSATLTAGPPRQALGFLTTNLSLRFVPVSFSHTIKACECLFTAALTFAILRQVRLAPFGKPTDADRAETSCSPDLSQAVSLPKYLSLLPVAGGVALSSFTELQFSAAGFAAAMASNLCFASRSVLTTRLFRRRDVPARTLYWLMCCGALLLLSPLFARQIPLGALLTRGGAGITAEGVGPAAPLAVLALCGLAHFSCAAPAAQLPSPPHPQPARSPPAARPQPARSPPAAHPQPARSPLVHLPPAASLDGSLPLCQPTSPTRAVAPRLLRSYNLLSFMILQRTTPITHVILHAVRRMLVIGVSSAMLRNRITYLNWAGIFIAFMGVLGYTLSDRLESAPQGR